MFSACSAMRGCVYISLAYNIALHTIVAYAACSAEEEKLFLCSFRLQWIRMDEL